MTIPQQLLGRRHWIALALFLVVTLAVGQIGGLITAGPVKSWYPGLSKPGFTPPDWLFPVAWTSLYLMMAFAAWLVWRSAERRPGGWGQHAWLALALYGVQLAVNLVWTILFFAMKSPLLGLMDIFLLAALVLATLLAFKEHSKLAAWLMLPYLAWVCYATILNFEIWRLN